MTSEINRRPKIRLRLHWKILLYSSALLVALIVAMLVYVRAQAQSFVSGRAAVCGFCVNNGGRGVGIGTALDAHSSTHFRRSRRSS